MLNAITIMARLGKTPELLKTGNGRSYCHLRIACDRDIANSDGTKVTDWFDATAWGRTAEFICKYFKQGDPILLNGSLRSTSWTDRNGNKKYGVEINVDNVYFCGGKRRNNSDDMDSGDALVESAPELVPVDLDEDDCPF